MIRSVLIFVVVTLTNIRPASTNLETVWLKDVTTNSHGITRTVGELHLPNELTFHLRRASDDLTLNLKRNHDIDPNVGVYFSRKLEDGRSVLVKTRDLEKEDVAYYQDTSNEAFMTVRCLKRSTERCDRVINGNMRIGASTYHLQPAETDLTPGQFMEDPGLVGKRYVLQEQEHTDTETLMQNKDSDNINEKQIEHDIIARLRPFEGQHNEITRMLKRVYNVNVAILIDPGIWKLYESTIGLTNPITKSHQVKAKIKYAYSHVMNGVSHIYKGIRDPSISINISLCAFVFFKKKLDFPHELSNVAILNGKQYINAKKYLQDLFNWDHETGAKHPQAFDQAIMYTRYDLYKGDPTNNAIRGISFTGGVCLTGSRTSVVEAGDFGQMILTTAHELGHSLGSRNDGEIGSQNCDARNEFIMSHYQQQVTPGMPYNRNNHMFSHCSVAAFKETLNAKQCLTDPGIVYNQQEYTNYLKTLPGELYTPNVQCHLIMGRSSISCMTAPENICRFMRCTDPKTGACIQSYYSAAMGTDCNNRKWCNKGMCVTKPYSK
ncbi:hypothetical protein CHS0354_017243 [Potamilus streckersoni]|uniref:Peptidase M12B domain-containing protein n=1 Tax=Potamilus streckersoni TaxID=2493646 RepID=A0AAE0RYS5_9BIVA|nr:hypothetical protein CHS0354_017243 [Potamilus streckersoni]